MMLHIASSRNRRAAIAPLAAVLMGFLVGMLAFSIDIGYICSVQAELQDAADAAALAGAQQLQSYFVSYYAPGQTQQSSILSTITTNTKDSPSPVASSAETYAAYNQAGGVYIKVPYSDVTFSYYDGSTFSSPSSSLFPNTVNVTTRRDTNSNGSLSLFFAQIFGISNINLTASASATIYAGDVSSLQAIAGVNAHILPVALDMNVWANFASGNFTFTNGAFVSSDSPYLTSSNVTAGSNQLPQLQIYPSNTNTPGNFGLLDVGVPSNSTPAFRNWIDDGSTANDITYLLNNKLLPVSLTAPKSWKCGPGLKSTLVSNFYSVEGIPNLIPLFQPYSALPNYVAANNGGQNATYSIVGFAGVSITQADGSGSAGMTISIQPAAIVDPTAVISNASPARASQQTQFGTPQTTFVSAKLSR